MIYGLDGYKVHSKLCLITRKTDTQFECITQIGTGNYNEKTSRLYTDLSLMTANTDIGVEAARYSVHLQKVRWLTIQSICSLRRSVSKIRYWI